MKERVAHKHRLGVKFVGLLVTSLLLLLSVFLPGCGNDGHASIQSKLQDLLDSVISEKNIPGVVLHVVDPSQGEWSLASGVADIETQTPMKPTYRLRVGSTTKTFTAAAIMLLQQDGLLHLDDPISNYVPELHIPLDSVITIRQLLHHSSGLADYSNETDYCNKALDKCPVHHFTPEELVQAAIDVGSNFYPGAEFKYCNTGYLLAALIIEKANDRGLTYPEFIRTKFIEPLGLSDTFVAMDEMIPCIYAHGYQDSDEDGLQDATIINQSFALGAGNIVSTVGDLVHWARALFGGQVLDEKSMAEMMDVVATDDPVNSYYGLGCSFLPGLGYGHPGATPGYLTEMRYEPDTGVAIVTSLNESGEDPVDALYEIARSAKRILGYDVPE